MSGLPVTLHTKGALQMKAGRVLLLAAAVGVTAAVTTGAVLMRSAPEPTDYILMVNGSPVCEAEFRLLLRENQMAFERDLREEFAIPAAADLAGELGSEGLQEQLVECNVQLLTQVRTEQALGEQYGVSEAFRYKSFLEELEQENRRRQDAISKGDPVYGLRSFTPEQYYSYKLSNLRNELLRTIPDGDLGVSRADAVDYYRTLETYAGLDGERIYYTLCDVTEAQALGDDAKETLYSEVSKALNAGDGGAFTAGEMSFSCEVRAFTPDELRDFLRQSFDAEFLLALAEGEVTGAFSLGGRTYLARYDGFDKAEALTEQEIDAFMPAVRGRAYERLVAQKAASAEVTLNENFIYRLAGERGVSQDGA